MSVTEKRIMEIEKELKEIKKEIDEMINKMITDDEKYDSIDVYMIDEINEEIGECFILLELAKSYKNLYRRKEERLMNKLNAEREREKEVRTNDN